MLCTLQWGEKQLRHYGFSKVKKRTSLGNCFALKRKHVYFTYSATCFGVVKPSETRSWGHVLSMKNDCHCTNTQFLSCFLCRPLLQRGRQQLKCINVWKRGTQNTVPKGEKRDWLDRNLRGKKSVVAAVMAACRSIPNVIMATAKMRAQPCEQNDAITGASEGSS